MANELVVPIPAMSRPKKTEYTGPISIVMVYIGELSILLGRAMNEIFRTGVSATDVIEQMSSLGVSTIPIALITIFASGAVLSLYFAPFLSRYGETQFVGGVVALAVARELAPVLTGITFTARSGSMIAAEIGTMKVTEQIDALRALAVSPIRYLVAPRLIAALIMLPVLCILSDAAGIVGGYLVAATMTKVPASLYIESIKSMLQTSDFTKGMIKTIVFGIVVALVGCHQGLKTTGGATGVGKATTHAVVISIVMIYLLNFVLADLLFPQ